MDALGDGQSMFSISTNSQRSNRHAQTHTSNHGFPWDKLCEHNDLTFYLVTNFMPPATQLLLFSTSKRFNYLVSSHFKEYMIMSAKIWAVLEPLDHHPPPPPAIPHPRDGTIRSILVAQENPILTIFPYIQYKYLCVVDPAYRTKTTRPAEHQHLPSFRYLFFLQFRVQVIESIVNELGYRGLRLPKRATPVIAKLWFLMDLPMNRHRILLVHNRTYFSDLDIRLALMFFVKLDMAFTEPCFGPPGFNFRRMMLAQRSLSTLERVLKREECRTPIESIRMFIKWKYKSSPENEEYPIFGVPSHRIGKLQFEGWGLTHSGSNVQNSAQATGNSQKQHDNPPDDYTSHAPNAQRYPSQNDAHHVLPRIETSHGSTLHPRSESTNTQISHSIPTTPIRSQFSQLRLSNISQALASQTSGNITNMSSNTPANPTVSQPSNPPTTTTSTTPPTARPITTIMTTHNPTPALNLTSNPQPSTSTSALASAPAPASAPPSSPAYPPPFPSEATKFATPTQPRAILLRPDQLILAESIRRRLHSNQHILEYIRWGFVDPVTQQNVPLKERPKKEAKGFL